MKTWRPAHHRVLSIDQQAVFSIEASQARSPYQSGKCIDEAAELIVHSDP
jgi:hypothetical protein